MDEREGKGPEESLKELEGIEVTELDDKELAGAAGGSLDGNCNCGCISSGAELPADGNCNCGC